MPNSKISSPGNNETLLAGQRVCDLLNQVASVESLDAMLTLLGTQIHELGVADAYLINLVDAAGKNLITQKLRLTPEFQMLEQTTLGYRNSLSDGYLNAKVFNLRSIQHVNHENASDAEKLVLKYWRVNEFVGVPILNPDNPQEVPLGVVMLLKQVGSIANEALEPLQKVLALLFKSLHNWMRFAQLEKMHDKAQAAVAENARLLEFLDEMSSLTSIDKVYDLFAVELFRQLPFDLASFALQENDMLAIKKVIAADPRYAGITHEWRAYLEHHPAPLDPSYSGGVYVLLKDESVLFPDVQTIKHLPVSPHDAKSIAILRTPRTLFIAPIRYQKRPIGVLALYSLAKPISLSEADRRLLEQLSSFLGTAIANSKTYATSQAQNVEIGHLNMMLQEKVKQLAEQASTDRLTGLFNFRSFEQELGKRVKECQRFSEKKELSLALVDIDRFKQFNDSYGHAAGNDILAGVAQEIRAQIRETDIAFRYGGEEFVVILPKCDIDGAMLLAERIRTAVEARVFDTSAGPKSVTVSVGCTMVLPNDTQQSFFNRADEALYKAKNTGRNRVCTG